MIFSKLYSRVIAWSGHRHAQYYLAGLSFAESSFFPIPPDVLLAPMVVANRDKAMRLALLTTVASVLGGILGYMIGHFGFYLIEPYIAQFGYQPAFDLAVEWFQKWGFWAVFVAGFSPIPYKVFTIAAGVFSLALIPFVIASAIGRGARFFLVAQLMATFGAQFETVFKKYIEWIGWLVVLFAFAAYLMVEF
ncbi:MAG: DedA family protein [Gammaproteobacteria bacterium]|nr:DedA family protein [Gammaproteobacteria bacterium]